MPEAQEGGWKDRLALAATLVSSLAIGIGVFFFLPLAAAQATGSERDAVSFNLLAGLAGAVSAHALLRAEVSRVAWHTSRTIGSHT